jgi:hypothetical protein
LKKAAGNFFFPSTKSFAASIGATPSVLRAFIFQQIVREIVSSQRAKVPLRAREAELFWFDRNF